MTTDVDLPRITGRSPESGLAQRGLMWLRLYFSKRRERLVLSELSDDQLDDIGVTRSEARAEVGKSWFWE